MAASNALIKALKERGRQYRKQVKAVRQEASEPAVHDLRSSIRRLRAVLDTATYFSGRRRVEKILDLLKDQMDATDDLRDVQVLLATMSRDIQQLPELEPVMRDLKRREARLVHAVEAMAQDAKPGAMDRRIQDICKSLEDLSRKELSIGLLQAADNAYSDLMYHYDLMNPSQPASLHQVRIGLRKFRYLLEILEPLLPGMPASHLEQLRTYQTLLGEIQDGTLFVDLSQSSDGMVPAARDHYEQEMSRALNTYLQVKDQIHAFWRHGPQEYLPWGAEAILKGQPLMDIYIIRHAIAVEAGTPGFDDDSQRPLTDKGRKKMKKIARAIKGLGLNFDEVISSPYVRARDTAEILVNELKLKDRLTFSDALVPPGDFDRLVHELTAKDGLDSVALVGHEPMLSQFIGWLTTSGGNMSLTLRKGGLAYLKAEDLAGSRHATLEWLLTPATMIALNS